MTSESILYVAAVFLLAGTVKGVVGLGLPTISMALLAIGMPPAQAAAFLIVPTVITNVWQAGPLATLLPLLKRLAPLQACIASGTLIAAWLWGAPAGAGARGALGAALVAYALWGLFGQAWHMARPTEQWLGPVAGVITGAVTALTGVVVIPVVPYLQALDLNKQQLIQAMGLSFTVATLALGVGLWFNQSLAAHHLGWSALMLVPALAGMVLGGWLRNVLSPARFRQVLMLSLLVLGAYQLIGAVSA